MSESQSEHSDLELSVTSECDHNLCLLKAQTKVFEHFTSANSDAAVNAHGVSDDAGKQTVPADSRFLLNRWYGGASLILLASGCVSFWPAEYVYLQTGSFYFDAVQHLNWRDTVAAAERWQLRWDWLLLAHVLTANTWVILASLQVLTGAFGYDGSRFKAYHRRFGYVAIIAALLFNIEAIILQKIKFVDWKADMTIIGNASAICFNLVLGIWAARAQKFPLHKQAMAWACAWTAAPGGVRLFRLILSAGRNCSLLSVNGYVAGSASMMLLAMIPATVATWPASEEKLASLLLFIMNFAPCAGGGLLDAIGVDAGTKRL